MSDTVLIDQPVTPYSPRGEILAWAKVCQEALSDAPDSQAWKDALADARRLLDEADLPGGPAA